MMQKIGNRELGEIIISTLRKLGAGRFFIAPGARSSPLVASLTTEETTTHFDERGLAFAALGYGLATGKLPVCITTSGSAVANLHPAVIEARYSCVPLLLLTADRPPRLRYSGANQTINQQGIFSPSILAEWHFPCPARVGDLAEISAILQQAWMTATGTPGGPVHLNLPFDEPLLSSAAPLPPEMLETVLMPTGSESPGRDPSISWPTSGRGLIVLGRLAPKDQFYTREWMNLAAERNLPVFADPASGASLYLHPAKIPHYDLLLQACPSAMAPDWVIHLGGALVSKRLSQWLSPLRGSHYYHFDPFGRKLDTQDQNPTYRMIPPGSLGACLSSLPKGPEEWFERWVEAAQAVRQTLAGALPFSEPLAVKTAAASCRSEDAFFVGNSMPIRDFDAFVAGHLHSVGPQVVVNRGASGIDGNIATACGFALGSDKHMTVVLGDLAALHDLSSFALVKAARVSLTLVILNNQGGGIFRFLPLPVETKQLETLWETPHSLSFQATAQLFGAGYFRPGNLEELEDSLQSARQTGGFSIVEIQSDRTGNHALHRQIVQDLGRLCLKL
jgi:2-succinyl-5-enolpyruvyl-6-hydroxy-3-cyclohexene-1-carboxylate synthase